MRIAVTFIIISVGLILLAVRLPSFLVNALAFHPSKAIPSLSGSIPDIEEVTLQAADGEALQAFIRQHANHRRLVLYFHGNAGNAYSRLSDIDQLYRTASANVLLLSYRGYGKSTGKPTERGVYLDAEAALAYAKDRLGFQEEQIFIVGRSLGSAVAIELAQHRQFAGLILVSPFTSGKDMARGMGLGWLAGLAGNPFDALTKMEAITSPTLFIHGDADTIIPIEMGRQLFEVSISKQKEFRPVPGAGHNNITTVAGASYWNWMRTFMRQVQGDIE